MLRPHEIKLSARVRTEIALTFRDKPGHVGRPPVVDSSSDLNCIHISRLKLYASRKVRLKDIAYSTLMLI